MADFKISGKNVITQAGTDEPVLASNVTLGTGIVKPSNISDAASSTLSCTTDSTITVATADTSSLSLGMAVSGTNIPANAHIVTIPNSTSFTITSAATGGATSTLTFRTGITSAKIENDAIDSQHIAADSIDAEHYAAGSVDSTAIANDAVDSQHLAADSIDAEHYAAGSVDATAIAADAVTTAKIAADAVTTAKIAADAVTTAKIAADAVGTTELANDVAINTSGVITTTGVGAIGTASTSGSHLRVHQATTGTDTMRITGGNAANADMLAILVDQATGSAFDFINCVTDSDGTPVQAFKVRGDGQVDVGGNLNLTASGSVYDAIKGYGSASHTNKGTGIWEYFSWTTTCDNVWRDMISVQDTGGFLMCVAGDAGTRNQKMYSWKITSPGYGVSAMTQITSGGGGWNSGGFEISYGGNPYYMRGRATSYYNSAGTATFQVLYFRTN